MPKPTVVSIPGPRTRLRPLAEADLPLTLAWRNQDAIRRWFVHSDLLTWEQHSAWFQRYLERDDDFLFVIEETAQLQRPIGQIGLYRIDWQAGCAEYGRIMIGEATAQGHGYAAEATAMLIDFAFRDWNLRTIELEVYADNERALRVYLRHGFESIALRDGLMRMRITPERFVRCRALRQKRAVA